jgi:TM2 domain-containing membrane protein YozV
MEVAVTEWYYIGHYGQLGPLTREQIEELVEGGVVSRETYVWHSGMSDWRPAGTVMDLEDAFRKADPYVAPPPPPPPSGPPVFAGPAQMAEAPSTRYHSPQWSPTTFTGHHLAYRSDKSRVLAGILQLLLPGVGRMYLGYAAYGVLQLVLAFCTFGLFWLWSFIDGLVILAGGLKMDGYGRYLDD